MWWVFQIFFFPIHYSEVRKDVERQQRHGRGEVETPELTGLQRKRPPGQNTLTSSGSITHIETLVSPNCYSHCVTESTGGTFLFDLARGCHGYYYRVSGLFLLDLARDCH